MLALVLGSVCNVWTPTQEIVSKDAGVAFTVSVHQQNLDQLKANALAASTPGNPQYGKYMTKKQIDELTAPRESELKAVTSWLDAHQISYSVANELVSASTTVGVAEKLLNTNFFRVSHPDHGIKTISGEYTLPIDVRRASAAVFGLRGLPLPKRVDQKKQAGIVEAPNPQPAGKPPKVTPTVLADTYSISGVSVKRGSGNTQAVAEFQGQLMNKDDLTTFFTNEVPTAQPGDDQVSKFVGVDCEHTATRTPTRAPKSKP